MKASTANPNSSPNPNQAFEGLNCEAFEDTTGKQWRYLKSDYAVDCDNEEQYGPVFRLAWIAICLYPLGIPTMSAPPPPAPRRPPPRCSLPRRPLATRTPPARHPHATLNPTPYRTSPTYWHGRYLLLLRSARVAIKTGRATQLSSALEFLHRDFEESYYAWEIVEQAHPNLKPQPQPQSQP